MIWHTQKLSSCYYGVDLAYTEVKFMGLWGQILERCGYHPKECQQSLKVGRSNKRILQQNL